MRVLAVDTSTRSCSVAVSENGSPLAELTTVSNQTHSKRLLDMIHGVVDAAGCAVTELDGFAVTVGPGSFTGLRIGISSVKGLAVAVKKPVAGVSSLEALAHQMAPSSHLLCPLLDARKREVYFAAYRFSGETLLKHHAEVVQPLDEVLGAIDQPCVFVGSGAQLHRQSIEDRLDHMACFAPAHQHVLRASTVASLGMQKLTNLSPDAVSTLAPHYIRKSDAELNFGKKKTVR